MIFWDFRFWPETDVNKIISFVGIDDYKVA
jgi:hypothetical protein